jgi:hypothetical protein
VLAATADVDIQRELGRIAGLVIACQIPDDYINAQVPPNVSSDLRIKRPTAPRTTAG